MRKVIEGKIYDTATAEYVCDVACTVNRGSNSWHDTALYRSPKGRYFLAGEGNAASMWAEPVGTGSAPGEGLRVVSAERARTIAESAGLAPDEMAAAGFTVEEG